MPSARTRSASGPSGQATIARTSGGSPASRSSRLRSAPLTWLVWLTYSTRSASRLTTTPL